MRDPNARRLHDFHKEFAGLFQQNTHRHRPHTVFSDFCEISALTLANSAEIGPQSPRFQEREARFLRIAAGYGADEMTRFSQMLGTVVLALEERLHDCLGSLFMALEMGNHWKGQYFSPFEVCSLMARMTAHDARTHIEQRGFFTVMEPASGAGAMVIALADALREQGLNYQRCMHVTAVDVDATAAHMCYLQLSLLHIPAVVIVGNSLTLEQREQFHTPAHVLGLWGSKLRREGAGVDLAEILLPTDRPMNRPTNAPAPEAPAPEAPAPGAPTTGALTTEAPPSTEAAAPSPLAPSTLQFDLF